MKTVRVIAAPGRKVPIHPSIATAPGGQLLIVEDGHAVELPDSSYVRRRMRAGDLVLAPAENADAATFARRQRELADTAAAVTSKPSKES